MPYIQKNLPAPPKTFSFSIRSFEGGLNNVVAETLIKDNQASDMCNLDFTEEAVLESRGGFKLTNTLDSAKEITFMDVFNPTYSEPKVLKISDGNLYIDNVLKLTGKSLISGVQFNDKYYLINGTEINVLGKFPQELSEHIKVWGTPNPDEIILKLVAPPADYTPLGTEFTIGVYHYNYDNMTLWYEPCTNELNDEFKGVNIIPTSPTIICVHKERLYIISDLEDPGSIYISDIDSGTYFPTTLGLHIPPTGDRIVGMYVYTDSVIVGTSNDLYVIYGDTNRSTGNIYMMKKINSHTGFKNNKSICTMHNNLVFLGNDNNIYTMYTTKTDVSILMTSILNRTVNLLKYPISATSEILYDTSFTFNDDKLYVNLKGLDKVLIYSYRYLGWLLYVSDIELTSSFKINNELLFVDKYGSSYVLDKTLYSDNGRPFASYWHSRRFSFNDDTLYKKFKEMYIVAHTFDDIQSNIKVTYEIDYVDIEQEAIIKNQKSRWGISSFGDRFITRNITPSLPITIGQRGRFIKLVIHSGYFISKDVETLEELQIMQKANQMLYYVTSTDKYYLNDVGNLIELGKDEVIQPMKLYNISGTYQIKGRR